MAADLLFATLDPTMRAISLPAVEKAILSDTVGFISDLPTQLVAAFRATLEEVTGADLIVHVRDIANPETAAQKQQVLQVLADLGVASGEDEDGEPTGQADPATIPELVVDLTATEVFLKERMMNLPEEIVQGTHNTEEGFLRRLAIFNAQRADEDTGKIIVFNIR